MGYWIKASFMRLNTPIRGCSQSQKHKVLKDFSLYWAPYSSLCWSFFYKKAWNSIKNNGPRVKILKNIPTISIRGFWNFEYFDPKAVIFWSSSKDFFTKMINKKSPTKFDTQKRLLILHRKTFFANLENQQV